MIISSKLRELVKHFEGCKLTAYVNTFYENGVKVKHGDKITQQRAEEL